MKYSVPKKIVLIGASTGGPGQIQKIFNSLDKLNNTTIIIAQHMVPGFMESFANRLQNNHSNTIEIITDEGNLKHSHIYISEGETKLIHTNHELIFNKKKSQLHSYNPNINILFDSFTPLCKEVEILCVILTGIGDDGVDACLHLSKSGARCITETQQSAIVDGMPNRARALVPNIEIYDIEKIINIISEFCE